MTRMSSLTAAQKFHAYANPARFMALSARLLTPLWILSALVIAVGLWYALFNSPPDYQQSETVRIMYVHVPAAWLSMFGYSVMAVASAVALIFRHPLADVAAKSAAPLGAAFTFLALATGSLWGKPMWGTWWEWDARMTSVLILLFLYLGYMALWATIEDPLRAARAAAVLALAGAINIPVIRYPHRRADHCAFHVAAARTHGRWLHAAFHHAASGGNARRDSAPPRSQSAPCARRLRRGGLSPWQSSSIWAATPFMSGLPMGF